MLNSAVLLSLVMIGVKAVGLFREVVLADHFGISVDYESVFIAALFMGAPLSIVFVPLQTSVINRYVKFKSSSFIASYNLNLLVSISVVSGLLIAFWAIVMLSFARHIFENPSVIVTYIPYLFVYIWISAINVFLYGLQQSRRHFMMTGVLPVANHGLVLLGYLVFDSFGIPFTARVVLSCMVLSVFLELFVLCRVERFSFRRFKFVYSFRIFRFLIYRSRYLIFTSVLATLMPILEQRISSSYLPGGALIIKYASMFPLAISSVIVTSLSVVILPFFSKMKNDEGVSACIDRFMIYTLYFISLALVVVIIISTVMPFFIDVFFEHSLNSQELSLVKNVGFFFVISSVVGALYLLTVRFVSSLEKGKLIFYSTVVCNLINVILLSVIYDDVGFYSIPVSTILSQGLVFVFLLFRVYRERGLNEQ